MTDIVDFWTITRLPLDMDSSTRVSKFFCSLTFNLLTEFICYSSAFGGNLAKYITYLTLVEKC